MAKFEELAGLSAIVQASNIHERSLPGERTEWQARQESARLVQATVHPGF